MPRIGGRNILSLALSALFLLTPLFGQTSELTEKSHHAKELMDAGRYEEAIPIYRELVRALPKNPGLITNLGLALEMAGRKRDATREFEAALKLDPHQATALLLLGTAHLDLGEYALAIPPLQELLKAQPDNVDAREILGESFLALGRFEQSAEHYEKVEPLDARNPKVWYGLGLSYQGLAQQNFDQLAKDAPGSAYWLDLVGESRLKVLQYNSAFFLYRQALAQMPTLRGAHTALADIYKSKGHDDWASVEEQKESTIPPPDCTSQSLECDFNAGIFTDLAARAAGLKSPESYYWRTRAYNQLTLQAFARLGELPPSPELHELMAKIKYDRRQYFESIQEWQEALKLSPGNPYIQKEMALSMIRNKDLAGAQSILQVLIKQSPDSPELNYMLGDTLLNLQKVDEAIPYLKKAVAGDPRLLDAQGSLARAYLATGEAQKAVPHLKAALPIDDDGSLHYQLARAYQASGRAELAKAVLKEYQEIVKTVAAENKATAQEVQITAPE